MSGNVNLGVQSLSNATMRIPGATLAASPDSGSSFRYDEVDAIDRDDGTAYRDSMWSEGNIALSGLSVNTTTSAMWMVYDSVRV